MPMNQMMQAPAQAAPAPAQGGGDSMRALQVVRQMAEQDPQFLAALVQMVQEMSQGPMR